MNRIGIIGAVLFTVAVAIVVAALFRTRDDHRIETDSRLPSEDSGAVEARIEKKPEPRAAPLESDAAPARSDAQATSDSADALVVAIVDSEDRPIPEARLAIHRDGVLLAKGVSDETGRLRLPGAPGRARCTVASIDRPMTDVEIPLVGSCAIALEDGAECEGIVRVTNTAYAGAIEILVDQDDPVREQASIEVREALGDLGSVPHRRRFSDDEGRFRFDGLSPESPLTLVFEGGFVLASDDSRPTRSFELDAPRSGVLVELHLLPRAVGRLIDRSSGSSVAQRHVAVVYDSEEGRTTAGSSTDADGRFSIALAGVSSQPLTLLVPNGSRRIEILHDGPVAGVADFGVIAVASPRTWRFAVRDTDGAAIAGARAAVGDGYLSLATDEEGLGEMADDFTQVHSAIVGARGFRSTRVDVALGEDDRQVIVLERCNSLRVAIGTFPQTLEPTRARVRGPLTLRPSAFDDHLGIATLGLHALYDDGAVHERERTLDPTGRTEFFDLGPNAEMTVAILDPDGQVIATVAVSPLGTRENREVRVGFDPGRFVVAHVEVVAEDGRGIPDANIRVVGLADRTDELVTDENGRFRLVLERDAPRPSVLIVADGYVQHELDLQLSDTGVRRVVLQRDE